jgi:hypothetical protein
LLVVTSCALTTELSVRARPRRPRRPSCTLGFRPCPIGAQDSGEWHKTYEESTEPYTLLLRMTSTNGSVIELSLIKDPEIPALGSLHDGGLDGLFADFGLPTPVTDTKAVRYHRGSRCVFFACAGNQDFVAKAYAKDPSPLVAVLRELEEHGVAGGHAPKTARLLAFDLSRRILVWERLRGATCFELISDGSGAAAGRLAAMWIKSIQQVPIELGRPYSPDRVLRKGARYVRVIEAADARIARAAAHCLRVLSLRCPRVSGTGLRHGSFSVHHVLELEGGPATIDWDAFGQGPVELDVANFLMTLRRTAQLQPDLVDQVSRAREIFLNTLSGMTNPFCQAWYESAMLLKLARYYCHRRPPNWREAAAEVVSISARAADV